MVIFFSTIFSTSYSNLTLLEHKHMKKRKIIVFIWSIIFLLNKIYEIKNEQKNDSIFIQQQFEKEDLKTNIRN
jgi:hypothetical protein